MTEPAFDDKRFEAALQTVLAGEKHDYPAYIGGLKVASGTSFLCSSPVDSAIIFGTFQEPEPGTMKEACEAADRAFPAWSAAASEVRAQIVNAVADAVNARRYELAAEVLIASGLPRRAALAETDRLVAVLRQAAQDALQVPGKAMGVWAVIATYSSPLASPMGYAGAAIAAGNTVVLRADKHCPTPVFAVYQLFVAAGLPDGVLNVIMDRNDRSAEDLASDPLTAGIVASGTGKIMEDLMFLQVDEDVGFINEIKGMNPAIVAKPLDVKKAATDVLMSAFTTAGQGLYACSKVIVLAEDEQAFTKALVEQVKDFTVDDPADATTVMGPLISPEAGAAFIKINEDRRGAQLYGGKKVVREFTANGVYYSPAIMTGLSDDDDLMYMDSGLPVLAVKVVADAKDALAELDDTECGLSAGLFTRDASITDRFKKALANTDLQLYVNCSSMTLPVAAKALVENFRR